MEAEATAQEAINPAICVDLRKDPPLRVFSFLAEYASLFTEEDKMAMLSGSPGAKLLIWQNGGCD